MSVVTWVLTLLVAVAFAAAGGMKLATPKEKLRENPQMGWTEDFSAPVIQAIGAAEVLGALGLVLPWWLDVAPVLTPLAGLALTALMAGAVGVHLRRREYGGALPAAVLGLLALLVAVLRLTQS